MIALVAVLSAAVGALILSIKTLVNTADPTASDNKNLPLIYLGVSLLASIAAALVFNAANPTYWVGDPVFATMPAVGAIIAGLIAVLPPGVGTTLLTLLALRNAAPGAQSAGTKKGFILFA